MPSLRMKSKSTISCLKEKTGLHVCKKSSMICKSTHSQASISKSSYGIETLIQSSDDVSVHGEAHVQYDGANEASPHELIGGENHLVQKQQSLLTISATDRLESTSSACTSSLETIFSPILETADVHCEMCTLSDGGRDNLYVPQLETEDSEDSSRSSCEYHTCNISDFYISDMIVSGLPTESNLMYDDTTATDFLPDFKREEPSMFFNMTEDYLLLPFLDDATETAYAHEADDVNSQADTAVGSDDSSLYLAIHQLRSCDQDSSLNAYLDSAQDDCFDPHVFIRNMPEPPETESNLQPSILPKETQKTKSITLVLDLDETLVHSTLDHCDDADFTFPVFFNMKENTVYVKKRPHLKTFLERVADMFEIVIFTASQSIYAKQLLDILDPDGKLISRRAYRESCIFSDGTYTKDLTILGVDLAKVAIIDNSPQVFRLQVNNGIPIKSWFDDPSDCALLSIIPFLETLVDADDVRPIIAKKFGNKE